MANGKPGRQTGRITMTPAVKAEVCEWISGGKSVAAWCRETGIAYSTVTDSLREDAEFASNYARAREDSADADADLVSDIRQQVMDGTLTPEQGRVAIDACKWTSGKRQPKKYGDRLGIDVGGAVAFATAADLEKAIEQRRAELAAATLAIEAERVLEAEPAGAVNPHIAP